MLLPTGRSTWDESSLAVCMRARVRACVCVRARVCFRVCVCVFLCVYLYACIYLRVSLSQYVCV